MIEAVQSENIWRKILFAIMIVCLVLINYGLLFQSKVLVFFVLGLQGLLIIFLTFKKYYLEIFILSLFFTKVIYWPLRLYFVLLLSLLIIFFYITYKNENVFNNLKLPVYLKLISSFLIISVFLSSILTPYISFFTVYYAFIFFSFLTTAYIVFKSIFDSEQIKRLLYIFIIGTFIAGLTKLFFVLQTGRFRALGFAEYFYMEFAPIALIIIFFLHYVSEHSNYKIIFVFVFIFLTMIADQSRFAWLGFIISLTYGTIVSFILSPEIKYYIKKKFPILVLVALFSVGLLFATGLDKIITTRISEIHFNFFQETEKTPEDQHVSNSLEARMLIWITAYNTFLQHPITGVGYFMFLEVSENYNVFPDFIYNLYVANCDAHTTYFNFLVDTGILGFSAFLIFSITIFIISFKAIKISSKENKTVSLILNILIFHMLFNSIYAGSYNLVPSAFFFYSISAFVVANYILLKEKTS